MRIGLRHYINCFCCFCLHYNSSSEITLCSIRSSKIKCVDLFPWYLSKSKFDDSFHKYNETRTWTIMCIEISLIPSLIFFCSGCIIVLQFLSQFIKSGGSDMLFHLTQPQHDRFTVTESTSWKHAFTSSLRHVSPRTTRLVSLSLMNYSGLPQNFLNEEPLKFLFDQINLKNLIRKMIPL